MYGVVCGFHISLITYTQCKSFEKIPFLVSMIITDIVSIQFFVIKPKPCLLSIVHTDNYVYNKFVFLVQLLNSFLYTG